MFLSNVNKRMGNDGSLRSPMWVRLKVVPLIRFYPRAPPPQAVQNRPSLGTAAAALHASRANLLSTMLSTLLTGALLKILMSLSLSN